MQVDKAVCDGTTSNLIFASNLRIAMKQVDNGVVDYYHQDYLGSTSAVTTSTGLREESLAYYPFGATRVNTGTVNVPYKFTDKELDASTALYFYEARYYEPSLGRFISPDTSVPNLFDPQSLNRYSYVNNNPLRYNDPTGHDGEEAGIPLLMPVIPEPPPLVVPPTLGYGMGQNYNEYMTGIQTQNTLVAKSGEGLFGTPIVGASPQPDSTSITNFYQQQAITVASPTGLINQPVAQIESISVLPIQSPTRLNIFVGINGLPLSSPIQVTVERSNPIDPGTGGLTKPRFEVIGGGPLYPFLRTDNLAAFQIGISQSLNYRYFRITTDFQVGASQFVTSLYRADFHRDVLRAHFFRQVTINLYPLIGDQHANKDSRRHWIGAVIISRKRGSC